MRVSRRALQSSVLFLAVVILIPASLRSEEARLILSGPMVGHVTDTTASIWLRVEEGAEVSCEPGGEVTTEDLGRGFRILHIGKLGGKATSILVKAVKAGREQAEKVSFRLAAPASSTGRVRFAFGSCSKISQNKVAPVYTAIADENPDFALFIGDNSYFIVGGDDPAKRFGTSGPAGDWTSPELMIARHLETRDIPELQPLLRTVPCYAVWDDHDYGPNNSDRTFALREEALMIFKQVWANPSYGLPGTPGIFGSFRTGPVEVFLMDGRYNKFSPQEHKGISPDEAQIWGDAQLEWLKAGLKASTAPVKIVANGTQILAETKDGEGHFQEAPVERGKLFSFLRENRIGGVVFLSGDRHYSEANVFREDGQPDLLEFTSSPICQGSKIGPQAKKHRTQLWAMKGDSYGLVTIEIPEEGDGTIRFETRDAKNHVPILNAARCVTNWEINRLNYQGSRHD